MLHLIVVTRQLSTNFRRIVRICLPCSDPRTLLEHWQKSRN